MSTRFNLLERCLSAERARELLSYFPGLTAELIPTWGYRISSDILQPGDVRDYLVFIYNPTGQIMVADITIYDERGRRLNPLHPQALIWEDFWRELIRDLPLIPGEMVQMALGPKVLGPAINQITIIVVIIGGIWLYNQLSKRG